MSDAAAEPIRVVYDCNTFLQAMAAPAGPAGRCVQLALGGTVRLFVSPTVLAELREVASRAKVAAKLRLTPQRTDGFVNAIEAAATVVEGFPQPFIYDRDPDDAHYVNLALAAGAKLIVSRDKDLLDLTDSTKADGVDFRARFPDLRILSPVQFLAELQRSSP